MLNYCCPNPECHKTFTVEEAEYSHGAFGQVEEGNEVFHLLPLIHMLCPECGTIVASVHVPDRSKNKG